MLVPFWMMINPLTITYKKMVKLINTNGGYLPLDLSRDLTGKTVKSCDPPGQWKVLELEFYTSEFCVQDPEAVESKIYGLPLAMQGVGCVCFLGVFFVTRYLCCAQNRYI